MIICIIFEPNGSCDIFIQFLSNWSKCAERSYIIGKPFWIIIRKAFVGLSHAVLLEACNKMYPPRPRSGRAAESSRDVKFGFLIAVYALFAGNIFARHTREPETRDIRRMGWGVYPAITRYPPPRRLLTRIVCWRYRNRIIAFSTLAAVR